ncbi:MAG: hypothetical protein RI947_50 [Candidatus Parcubacteria bacterium]|jgi:drug/metabolite transporter (DMT)-like permease
MNKYIGPLSLLTIGILFGLSGVIAKYLSSWLNPYQVIALRFAGAFIMAYSVVLFTGQKIKFKKLNKQTLLLFAVSFPISVIFFTLSVFYTKVSLAVFSFYIANLVSSFICGSVFFKETIERKKQITLLCIMAALICFTNPFQGFTLNIGFIFGLISGVLQTIASIFQKILGESTDRLGLVMIQTLAGCVMAVIVLIFTHTLTIPWMPLTAWGVIALFGAMFLAISYLFLIGFQKTNLNVGSILVSSELLFGPLFALLLLNEMPSGLELLGGIFTIVAVVIANI